MRRDALCNPALCPDAPDDGGRCDGCPLDRLDAAAATDAGRLLHRAALLRAGLRLGIRCGWDDIRGDEFMALLVLEEELQKFEAEKQAYPSGK